MTAVDWRPELNPDTGRDASESAHGVRVERFTRGADLSAVADVLAHRRHEILERWLQATRQQPFHRGRPERAVADHLPHLIDGLVDLLRRTGPPSMESEAPLDDPAVLAAAHRHAAMRFEQSLSAANVVTEFRLLRQEIGRALRDHLEESDSPADVVAGELITNDALDGATVLSLQALTDKVEEVRADFLATTLHDAQQPISSVKLSVQMALRDLEAQPPAIDKAQKALRRADHSLDRMVLLLRRLADASRVALGGLELHLQETQLGRLVRRVIDDLDPGTAQRVRLSTNDADDSGLWDAAALEQVVGNLLSNAAKFSPAGSPIDIEVDGRDEEVRLTVRDAGRGVEPDDRERIFRRFERSRTARDGDVEGQGLGLYLSRGIVEAHGGRIWAEADGSPGGSAFHIILPRRPHAPGPHAS